jgi:hypothetical protein
MVVRSSSGSGHGTVGAEKVVVSALPVSRIDLATTLATALAINLFATGLGRQAKRGPHNLPGRHGVASISSNHYKCASGFIGGC